MLQGLRTIIYPVANLVTATAWYTAVADCRPYFNEPFYVGFNIGGYELGLLPGSDADVATGPVTYWGTSDIVAEHARLLSLGATPRDPIRDVGEGIKVATVEDADTNIVGIIENPHFKLAGTV